MKCAILPYYTFHHMGHICLSTCTATLQAGPEFEIIPPYYKLFMVWLILLATGE